MIRVQDLSKTFFSNGQRLDLLESLRFEISAGERVGIVGASGAGKSTLLHILGGLERPTRGEVLVDDIDLFSLSEKKQAALRNTFFGFVFQFYHLLPELTALENVLLPSLIAGIARGEGLEKAKEALSQVGLAGKELQLPSSLSGGEQQRVALARACALKPKMILADEPTGNLDEASGKEVLGYLLRVVEKSGGALIMVTHNRELTRALDRVYELKNGKLHQI